MTEGNSKCPVDHSSRAIWAEKAAEVTSNSTDEQNKCPVNHNAREEWLNKISVTPTTKAPPEAIEVDNTCSSDDIDKGTTSRISNLNLPNDREISTIPRTSSDSNWVYPSQRQFFEAMKRKNWNPNASDMKTVVPIHNAVNERAWKHILLWERSNAEETEKKCGGIKLTSFKGFPNKLTPRAWFRSAILGYEKPFDRHDWMIDRCGVQIEYVIDFYSGNGKGASFFLDVRPKLNTFEGVKLRLLRSLGFA